MRACTRRQLLSAACLSLACLALQAHALSLPERGEYNPDDPPEADDRPEDTVGATSAGRSGTAALLARVLNVTRGQLSSSLGGMLSVVRAALPLAGKRRGAARGSRTPLPC
jgi:hypothetical protein